MLTGPIESKQVVKSVADAVLQDDTDPRSHIEIRREQR